MKNNHNRSLDLHKNQSIILTTPIGLEFPEPLALKPSILSSLTSILDRQGPPAIEKIILPIPDDFIFLIHGNAYSLYRFTLPSENEKAATELLASGALSFNAKSVRVSPLPKRYSEKGFYLVVEDWSSWQMEVLYFSCLNKQIKKIKSHKIPSRILSWAFICENELLFWCENMKIYHYQLLHSGLQEVFNFNSEIDLKKEAVCEESKKKHQNRDRSAGKGGIQSPNKSKSTQSHAAQGEQGDYLFELMFSEILGSRSKEEDKIIVLFYVMYNRSLNMAKVRCRQILYPMEDVVENDWGFKRTRKFPRLQMLKQMHEIITSNTADPEILKVMKMVQIEDAYFLRFQFEIVVIRKKFNRYLAMTNIYKKDKQCFVQMSSNSNLVVCIVDSILEINEINVSSNKTNAKMIDFIDLNYWEGQRQESELNQNNLGTLVRLWISASHVDFKKTSILFLFEAQLNDGRKYLKLLFGEKTMKLKKLTNMAQKKKRDEEILKIQQIGSALGVTETDFYFNLWKQSKQTSEDIFNYLLKCCDYEKIFIELESYLRRRKIKVVQFLKMLTIISEVSLNELRKELSETNMINYFQSCFIHRKFTILQSDYELNEKEFRNIIDYSIFDLFYNVIQEQLFPPEAVYSPWVSERVEPPKINIIQILDAFKLPLLQDYAEVLRTILTNYNDNDIIIAILQKFPQLLPNFPFLPQTELVFMNLSILINQTKHLEEVKQKSFFSKILPTDLKRESAFLESTLALLDSYYCNSDIIKMFERVLEHPTFKEGKFHTHMIISSSSDEYTQKVDKNGGTVLYITYMECLIKGALSQGKPASIHELLQILRESHHMDEETLFEMEVASNLYELMLKNDIIRPNVSLYKVYTSPIEKWIALFFLGEKQKKELIFDEFMAIFPDTEDFTEALKKYVKSEHCSKIELTILIDLVHEQGHEFQRKHQDIIEVIIFGFCSRIELRDTAEANHFLSHIRHVEMAPELIRRVDHIEKLKLCSRVFQVFSMESISLQFLLEETIQIIQDMLECFFEGRMKKSHISLEQNKILKVEDCNGMFELLYYLRDNFFYQLSPEDLVVTYCIKLIEWQQFKDVTDLIYNSNHFEYQSLHLPSLIPRIQIATLEKLYQDESLFYDEDIKTHIKNILALDRDSEDNIVAIQEEARLNLAAIFSSWDLKIRLNSLNIICEQWQERGEEAKREALFGGLYARPIMLEIIESYAENIDLSSLKQIYRNFMSLSEGTRDPEIKTDEFYNYCTKLSDIMMTNNRLKEVSEIICIVNQKFEMNYYLMAECLLRSLLKLYGKKKNLLEVEEADDDLEKSQPGNLLMKVMSKDQSKTRKGSLNVYPASLPVMHVASQDEKASENIIKRYIDYFVLNWSENNESNLNKIFRDFFQDTLENREEVYLHLNPDLCFKSHRHKISTQEIWNMVKASLDKDECTDENLYYGYFFLTMGLMAPKVGFQNLDYLSYDHLSLSHILKFFKEACDSKENLYCINYVPILQAYLDALTRLVIIRHQDDENEDSDDDSPQLPRKNPETSKTLGPNVEKNAGERTQINPMQANLQVLRDMIKKKWHKTDFMAGIIIKFMAYVAEAKKNEQKRRNMYIHMVKSENFRIEEGLLKVDPRERKMTISALVIPTVDVRNEASHINNSAFLTFDHFVSLKKDIKKRDNEKNFSMSLGPRGIISDRALIEEILGNYSLEAYPDDSPLKTRRKQEEIAGLAELIQASRRDYEQRSLEKPKRARAASITEDLNEVPAKKRGESDVDKLLQAIESGDYEAISGWNPDGIFVEVKQIYDWEEVKFNKILTMFYELNVGSIDKSHMLILAEPESLEMSNQTIKTIFSMQYLFDDFGSQEEHADDIAANIEPILFDLKQPQLLSLVKYLSEISKIWYRKAAKDQWINGLAKMGIHKIAIQSIYDPFMIGQLEKFVRLFTPAYLANNYKELLLDFCLDNADSNKLKRKFEQLVESQLTGSQVKTRLAFDE